MMDRDTATRIQRDSRTQQETIARLVHEAKAAEQRVVELERENEKLKMSESAYGKAWDLMYQNFKKMMRQRDSAREWAVRMESEAAGAELALLSSNPADAQWHGRGAPEW